MAEMKNSITPTQELPITEMQRMKLIRIEDLTIHGDAPVPPNPKPPLFGAIASIGAHATSPRPTETTVENHKKQYEINDYAENLIQFKARQLVGTAGFTKDDIEDLEQDMRLDLWQRLPKFDPGKAKYSTFVSRIINRKVCNLIRHRTQELRDYRCEDCSLHDVVEFGESGDEEIERIDTISQDEHDFRWGKNILSTEDRLDLRLDISLVLSKLPPELQKVAELLQTMSVAEAARELNIPRGSLYDRLEKLRQAFEESGIQKYLS